MKRRNKFIMFILTFSLATSSSIYSPKAASAISRQEAQDRAYKMAYTQWHYNKDLNGKTYGYIQLPEHLRDKTDSTETGIPYNYGGSDGIDTTSNRLWSNFSEALTKGATAGNVRFEGGYKGETAGIDSASFIQSSLKIAGGKLTSYTLKDYLDPISFDDLRNMDVLLNRGDSAAFFQGWVYDDYGNVIGAATLEATIDNTDGTGQKVKEFYRSKDYLMNNYKAYRYKYINSDYIESNSAQPTLESPLYRQAVDKKSGKVFFDWNFNDTRSNGYQSEYRIRIYKGDLNNSSDQSGLLVKEISGTTQVTETTVYLNNMAEGNYYFILETKNNRGYWSNPVLSPLNFVNGTSTVPSKINKTERFGGQDRYETSKIIAEENFKNVDLKNVVIASGNDFPDGLSGVTLARRLNSPLLLVDKNPQDSQVVLQYITKNLNKNGKIYILGGQGAVDSSYVEYFTKQGYSGNNIIRVGGLDRNDTSVKIAQTLNLPKGMPVIVTNDSMFADALSISSKAGASQMPILLTSKDSLNETVENYIKNQQPSTVYIVGGAGVVSENIKNKISNITSSKIVRLGGLDRYDTNEKINDYFYSGNLNRVFLANGENFPDSLSGSAAAAFNNGAPLVLVSDISYVNGARSINKLTGSNRFTLDILGGNGIVSNYLVSKINNAAVKLQ
ncbi:cell wall-binding repeat-containing protein [Clostridium sp. A1-XYC3]|uniref:Cell wall-binding repeat-containing protein n=1 Tax=Clostridium tanneri TaxID=3037988 RepID=A0ABU4JWP8_9CLOT|nr:cell wall-binding repeat-containing protein [Clostridium sp. A1-XYC3]MDW8802567.1 cell wall-binding repeat-containing protein [Clostridium sp. A1-XYC3]